MQPSDIDRGQLRSVCRNGTPCSKLGFRSDEGGTRIITCARDAKEFESPSEINKGDQHTTCKYKPSAHARMNVAGLSIIIGALGG